MATYQAKYPKATECLAKDREALTIPPPRDLDMNPIHLLVVEDEAPGYDNLRKYMADREKPAA